VPEAVCAPDIVFELWPRIVRRDTAEKPTEPQSKGPLLIDRFERHSHRRCPHPSAPQLSCLSSGRALDAEIAEKQTTLQEQRAFTYWPIGTPLTQKVPTALCAPVIMFELWPRSGRRDTVVKQIKLTGAMGPYLLPAWNSTCTAAGHCPLRTRCKVCALAAHWKPRYSRKSNYATRAKGPYLLTNWNATYTEGAHNLVRSSYHVWALTTQWKPRYRRKTNYATRAKGPYLLTYWKAT
jgi:hypothetical protein